jgi:FkbM family methyltransferase
MRHAVKRLLHRAGLDVVRVPHPYTLEKHLQDLLPRLGITCVLDVGANRGQYAQMLRRIGYQGLILSFEPIPANVAYLEHLVDQDVAWRVFPLALGDEDRSVTLNVSRVSELSSALPSSAYGTARFEREMDVIESVQVPLRRLDGVLEELVPALGAQPLFLKSDTQGYDLRVLAGASDCIQYVQGLQLELSLKPIYEGMPSMVESMKFVQRLGFEFTGFFPVVTDDSGALVEVDGVARRTGPADHRRRAPHASGALTK